MTDPLPVVWPAEPHTRAKHAILTTYLQAWMNIMSHQAAKIGAKETILFIDAFAGPGVYTGGEQGSPILAVRAAVEHQQQFPVPIHCLFIERRRDRFESLTNELAKYETQIAASANISLEKPRCGDCNVILNDLLDTHALEKTKFGPALVFLDQFGYSDVPMALIARIMRHPQCEIFSYLNYNQLSRFLTHDQKDLSRTTTFGSDDWKEAQNLSGIDRERFLLRRYKQNLREYGNSNVVWDFAMADEANHPIYWLFFCTNNRRGLEEMKSAMWRVDETGNFRFSDGTDPAQLKLLAMFGDAWLEDHLTTRFAGQTVKIGTVSEYVLTQTPCYKWASVLRGLRSKKKLIPLQRKRISFKTDLEVEVRFADKGLF